MKTAKTTLRVVGIFTILIASLGLLYESRTLLFGFQRFSPETDTPYFYHALYPMASLCIVFYILLIISGVHLMRYDIRILKLLNAVILAEILYFLLIVLVLINIPGIGLSIFTASGVANGGLMFQAWTLFPIWAPLLARWAAKRIEKLSSPPSNVPVTADPGIKIKKFFYIGCISIVVVLIVLVIGGYFMSLGSDYHKTKERIMHEIKIGMDVSEVIRILGEPSSYYKSGTKPAKYNEMGFYCTTYRVVSGSLYLYDEGEAVAFIFFNKEYKVEYICIGGS